MHFVEEAKRVTEILWGTPKSRLQQVKSILVEGLLTTQTFAIAGSESLADMSLKVCSFWVEGEGKAEVRHRSCRRGGGGRNGRTSCRVKLFGSVIRCKIGILYSLL